MHYALVSEDADESLTYLQDRGFDVRVEERDLHAEYMARGEPGRASFFVPQRRYSCVDLMRAAGTVARGYAHGKTAEDAIRAARRRLSSEQA